MYPHLQPCQSVSFIQIGHKFADTQNVDERVEIGWVFQPGTKSLSAPKKKRVQKRREEVSDEGNRGHGLNEDN